jgi:hypothetical protein
MALTPSKLITEYGAYYKEGSITAQNLHQQIYSTSDFKKLFMVKPTNDTRIDNINTAMSQVLQAFHSTFSPKGDLDFVPNPFNLDRVKINVGLKPDDLAATAVDFFVQKGVSRKDAPIVATIAEYLIAQAKEDDELYVAYKGVKAVGSGSTAGTTVGSRNGVRKVIRDYAAATKTNTIALGAVPTDPELFVDYLESFYWAIPEKFRTYIKTIAVSEDHATRYKRGMRIKYNQNYDQTSGQNAMIIDSNGVEIVGSAAQNASSLIWASPRMNCIGFIKNTSNQQVFDLGTKDIYEIQMATDWYEGYNFINPGLIWHNDQDLV